MIPDSEGPARRRLGAKFAPPAPVDRATGLRTGRLPTKPTARPDVVEPLAPAIVEEPPAARARSQRNGESSRTATDAGTGSDQQPEAPTTRAVVVYVAHSVHQALRARARADELTYADLVLDAVETQLDRLSERWRPTPPTKPAGAVFTRAQPKRPRRAEPAVQVLLRLAGEDADELDGLAARLHAPSRSAFVSEALRLNLMGKD